MPIVNMLETNSNHIRTILPWVSVGVALHILHQSPRIPALVVTSESGRVIGSVSEGNIVAGLAAHGANLVSMSVEEVMSQRTPTCSPRDSLFSVVRTMTAADHQHLLVVRDAELIGVVSLLDVVRARLTEMELESATVRDTVLSHKW